MNIMTDNFLTAAQARTMVETARSLQGEYLKKDTALLLSQISDLARAGKESIMLSSLDPIITMRLRSLGYEVTVVPPDQREDGYVTIAWSGT